MSVRRVIRRQASLLDFNQTSLEQSAAEWTQVIQEEHAVNVIVFVLNDPSQYAIEYRSLSFERRIQPFELNAVRPEHRFVDVRDGQASFLKFGFLLAHSY